MYLTTYNKGFECWVNETGVFVNVTDVLCFCYSDVQEYPDIVEAFMAFLAQVCSFLKLDTRPTYSAVVFSPNYS